jgi:hypothetical protein
LVTAELRSVLRATQEGQFPLSTASLTAQDIAERLRSYERVSDRLSSISLLMARWGEEEQRPVLSRMITRLADGNERRGGKTVWLGLRWYPVMLALYAGGIGALSAENYKNLEVLFSSRIASNVTPSEKREVLVATVKGILDVERTDAFKLLPGYERNYVPRSEYLFKTLQPLAEDLLFVGRSYEELFDKFEVFYALVYADMTSVEGGRVWGPPGRFAWKFSASFNDNPLAEVMAEAKQAGAAWPPLSAGLFGGSYERFEKLTTEYAAMIGRLGW